MVEQTLFWFGQVVFCDTVFHTLCFFTGIELGIPCCTSSLTYKHCVCLFVCLSVCLSVDSALFGKHCCTRRKYYTFLILYPGSVLSHSSPILTHIGPNYTNSSMSYLLVFLSAICSLIHVHHLFTNHKTCIPLCLKWQRSLKHVNYVFMRTGKTQASQHAN